MKLFQNLFLVLIVFCLLTSSSWAMGKKPSHVKFGEAAPSLYIYNPSEKELVSFPYVTEGKVSVVCFLSYECPLSRTVLDEASEFFFELRPKPVQVVGISSMAYETAERLKAYQKEYGIPFDLLYDQKGVLAYQFEVERSPTFFVFDQDQVLRYYGNVAGMKKAVLGLLYDLNDFESITPVKGCQVTQRKIKCRIKKEEEVVEEMQHFMAHPETDPQNNASDSSLISFANSM